MFVEVTLGSIFLELDDELVADLAVAALGFEDFGFEVIVRRADFKQVDIIGVVVGVYRKL